MAGETILLVDDEPHITQLAQMYLEREGFNIEAVADGQAALDAVEKLQPALMVLDVMLPEVDGFDPKARFFLGDPARSDRCHRRDEHAGEPAVHVSHDKRDGGMLRACFDKGHAAEVCQVNLPRAELRKQIFIALGDNQFVSKPCLVRKKLK